jgi:TPR repeat protein
LRRFSGRDGAISLIRAVYGARRCPKPGRCNFSPPQGIITVVGNAKLPQGDCYMRRYVVPATLVLALAAAAVTAQQETAPSDREVLFPDPAFDPHYQKLQRLADGYYEKGRYAKAYKIYAEDLALLGDKFAQYRAGYMSYTGQGVTADPPRGCAWMRLAAERGADQLTAASKQACAALDEAGLERARAIHGELSEEYGDRALLVRLIEEDRQQLKTVTGSRLGQTNAQTRVYDPGVRGSVNDAERYTTALEQRIEARTRYIELIDGNIEYGAFEVREDPPATPE